MKNINYQRLKSWAIQHTVIPNLIRNPLLIVTFLILNSQFSILNGQQPAYHPKGEIVKVMIVLENDTVYAFMPDTVGLYAINGQYYLPTVLFLEQYVAEHSGSLPNPLPSLTVGSVADTIVLDSNGYKQYENGVLVLSIDKNGRISQGITNTAFGNESNLNYEGVNCTSFGAYSLRNNTTGGLDNTAVGESALYSNINGDNNTAIGRQALVNNTNGYNNIGIGYRVLYNNTTGYHNTSIGGYMSLYSNITGYYNTAVGDRALYSNTSAYNNIALGAYAGMYGNISNRLYINSLNRTNILGDTTNAIIYGNQSATTTAQHLYLNAQTHIKHNLYLSNSTFLPYGVTYIPSVPSVLMSDPDSNNFVWAPLQEFNNDTLDRVNADSVYVDQFLKLTPTANPPSSASEGMIYFDTDHHLYYHNGTTWVQLFIPLFFIFYRRKRK